MPETQRHKIRDMVASQLKSYIVDQKLRTGDRLPTESQLATQLSVSRLSVREATKALEYMGVIDSKPGRGLSVGHVNVPRVAECLSFLPSVQDAAPAEWVEARIIIETGALPHVIRRMHADSGLYDQLAELIIASRSADDPETWNTHDWRFHRQLVQLGGLAPLSTLNDILSVFFQQTQPDVQSIERAAGADSHERLINHLRDGDLTAADQELRRHIGGNWFSSPSREADVA